MLGVLSAHHNATMDGSGASVPWDELILSGNLQKLLQAIVTRLDKHDGLIAGKRYFATTMRRSTCSVLPAEYRSVPVHVPRATHPWCWWRRELCRVGRPMPQLKRCLVTAACPRSHPAAPGGYQLHTAVYERHAKICARVLPRGVHRCSSSRCLYPPCVPISANDNDQDKEMVVIEKKEVRLVSAPMGVVVVVGPWLCSGTVWFRQSLVGKVYPLKVCLAVLHPTPAHIHHRRHSQGDVLYDT